MAVCCFCVASVRVSSVTTSNEAFVSRQQNAQKQKHMNEIASNHMYDSQNL